jgi:hypothetical protein
MNVVAALDGRFLSITHSVHDMTYHHSVDKTNNPTFLPYPYPLVLADTPVPGPVAADDVISHDEGGGVVRVLAMRRATVHFEDEIVPVGQEYLPVTAGH